MNLLLLEKSESTAIIRINVPSELNALSIALLEELEKVTGEIAADENLRSVIITGEGKAFSAGANIAEMKDFIPAQAEEYGRFGNRVFRKLEILPVPVIAAINGFALGGGLELALACDIRLASDKAKFSFPEVTLGIMPGFGGTQRLPRLIGPARAKEMIFSANMLTAEQALEIGLVNAVYEPGALHDEALKLSKKIAANSPIGIRQAKAAIAGGEDRDLDSALLLESEAFGKCFATEYQKMAMTAFVEKRRS